MSERGPQVGRSARGPELGVDDATLRDLIKAGARDGKVWVTAFDFPKEDRR